MRAGNSIRKHNCVDNISFRLAKEDEHDGLAFCGLYNSFYAKKVDLKYYNWQFFGTPFTSLLCMVIDGGNTPIGFYGVHVMPGNQQDIKTAWGLDIMIRLDYQDRGLFRGLAQFAEEQLSRYQPVGIFVMANDKGAGAHIDGMGWDCINEYVSCVASTNTNTSPPPGSGRLLIERASFKSNLTCAEIPRLRARQLFAVKRDEAYTRWRYSNNPRFNYEQFKVSKGGDLFGYLVLKTFNDPVTSELYGDVVDLAWKEDDPQALAEMLRFALHHFNQLGVSQALTWLQSNTILDQVGVDVGFRQVDQKRFFCGKILDRNYSHLNSPQRWFVTLSDSEIY
jgi:hypothetical protein